MVRRKILSSPWLPPSAQGPKDILELDRFSEASLEKWRAVSQGLDQLTASLLFGTELERRRYQADLIAALQTVEPVQIEMSNRCRAVTYRRALCLCQARAACNTPADASMSGPNSMRRRFRRGRPSSLRARHQRVDAVANVSGGAFST